MKNKLPVQKAGGPTPEIPSSMHAKVDMDREMQYKAKEALGTLERAQEHMRDKELMKHVKKLGREKMKTLKDIC